MSDNLPVSIRNHLEITLSLMTMMKPALLTFTKVVRRRYLHVVGEDIYKRFSNIYSNISKCLYCVSFSKGYNFIQEARAEIFLMINDIILLFRDTDINHILPKMYSNFEHYKQAQNEINDLKCNLSNLALFIVNAERSIIPHVFHTTREKKEFLH